MIPQLLQQDKTGEAIVQLPYISLLVAFEPLHTSKEKIVYGLNTFLRKVEKELGNTIARYMVKPALGKLKSIFNNLNYNTATKSIAVSLSPFIEKIVYLNFPVSEKIVVGKVLKIKELLLQKEEKKEFFVIQLDQENVVIYLQQGATIKPIVVNSIQQIISNGELPSLPHFIKYADDNLSSILRAWKLPVIVVGNNHDVSVFKTITANESDILKYVPLNGVISVDDCIESFTLPLLPELQELKDIYFLKQLKKASIENRADVGIDQVWNASIHKRNDLLLIEEDFSYHAYDDPGGHMQFADAVPMNNSVLVYDAVEKIVEKVLAEGGDVVLVKKGVLGENSPIAVLRY